MVRGAGGIDAVPAPPGLGRDGWGTVVVCASGPSFTEEDASAIADARVNDGIRVVVVNESWRRLPRADVLYAHDTRWWMLRIAEVRAGFSGECWTQSLPVAKRFGLHPIKSYNTPGLTKRPGCIHNGGNSGYGAINLAYLFGARRILLVGFDMRAFDGASHWHGDHAEPLSKRQPFHNWIPRFRALADDLKAVGVDVINCSPISALACFPKASLADALASAEKVTDVTSIMPLSSIIIPTFDEPAALLQAAVRSAIQQTARIEIIVVDDGGAVPASEKIAAIYGDVADTANVRVLRIEHGGPAVARNAGIEVARGEFVCFLDADDTLEPTAVAERAAAFTPEVGWIICDTKIVEPDGRAELASRRYGYAAKGVGGWIAEKLEAGNFLPIHAPLIRRSAIGDLRFEDRDLEDWHFWHALAKDHRCRYLPRVLATYRKRGGSRNSTARATSANRPGVDLPLRLNLGCGTPGALSWHPMPGLINLDKSIGWRFEDGLRDFADATVAGITVSHALMYVRDHDLPPVFAEFARVLEPRGVLRITEDDTTNPASRRFGGWKGSESAVIQTDARKIRALMESAGFTVYDVDAGRTMYRDDSLRQAQHGEPPDVFFIEGVREVTVLFEPHADDGALFAAFTVIRHRPRIVTCFPSAGDYGDTETRAAETREAMAILGGAACEQWDGREIEARMRALDDRLRPTLIWAPSTSTSHRDHMDVAVAAARVFGDRLRRFQTYDASGKVRGGELVAHEPGWVDRKRRALACYRTQMAHPRAREFFAWDFAEYAE